MARQKIRVRLQNGKKQTSESEEGGTIHRLEGDIITTKSAIGSAKTLESAIAVAKSDAQQITGSSATRVDVE